MNIDTSKITHIFVIIFVLKLFLNLLFRSFEKYILYHYAIIYTTCKVIYHYIVN